MNLEALRFDDLLQSVADGEPIDWEALESSTDPSARPAVRHLRLVAGIAEVHRSAPLARLPSESPLPPVADGPGRWGHLAILEKTGEGAFGEVFRAHDPWLERDVALKLMKAGAPAARGQARLLDEARKLARVRHPNVVTVYGADEHHGRVGLWMELVRGKTLAAILRDQGSFSAGEATVIGQELCRALAAVHAVGLVHQDVKPQNVMREAGGRYLLMDFGAGATPLYLAPEVLAGGAPTASSDLYALGALLFHLVTGQHPVRGGTVAELERAHAAGSRQSLAALRPELPDAFVAAVGRAIDPDPRRRFAHAGEMRDALSAPSALPAGRTTPARGHGLSRRPLLAFGLAAALLGITALFPVLRGRAPLSASATESRSVVVLPFVGDDNAEDAAILGRSLSEDLERQLARVARLRIVTGSSIAPARATDASGIGTEVKADAVVSGRVRIAEASVGVTIDVLDVQSASPLLTRTFSRARSELGAIERDLATEIATVLTGGLTADERAGLQRRQPSPQAFELYLRGRYYWNTRTPDGLKRSIQYFNDAIAVDPDSALPHAGLADGYVLAAFYRVMPRRQAHAAAETAAARALEIDPDLAQVHAALGLLRTTQFRWADAELSLRRAIALDPGYAPAQHWYGLLLTKHRRFDEALSALRAARTADPFSYVLRNVTAYVYYTTRDYAAATREYRQVLDVDSGNYLAFEGLAETFAAQGDLGAALDAIEEARRRTGREEDLSARLAYVYALAGRREASLRVLKAVESRTAIDGSNPAEVACVYGALGQRDQAFVWLARAVEAGDPLLGYLGVDPRFDALRGDGRFEELVRSLGIGTR